MGADQPPRIARDAELASDPLAGWSGLALAPALAALAWPQLPIISWQLPLELAAGAGLTLLLLASVLLLQGSCRAGRVAQAFSLAILLPAALLQRPAEPGPGLLLLLTAGVLLVQAGGLFRPHPLETRRWQRRPGGAVRAASLAALAGAFLLHRFEQVELPLAPLLLGTTAPALWALRHERASPMLSAALWLLLGLLCMAAPAQVPPGALALVPLTCLLSPAARSSNFSSFSRLWAFVAGNPARLMVLSFLTICLIGGLALTLPLSHQPGQTAAFVDALFTSVSATCVTGLATVDTPTTWSFFGQLVIATLIQVGGLGIMTFAAGASVWLGARLSLRHEAVAADLIGPDARSDLRGALRTVLQVTFGVEALCALILWLSFMVRHGEAAVPAAWRAVFTAVSAFCNAGFALQSDSLITYQRDPIVILTIGFTIVIGGLGPAVAVAVAQRRAFKSLYPRMVVTTSALLLLIPAVLIAFFEWNHTLTGLSTVDRLVNALFQSITLRTAGFNSVDIAAIQPPTWTVMVIAMFIGGSPASTAGGIKTTTFAVLVLSALAAIRGRDEATAWKRRIPHRVVYDAAAITMLMMLCVLIGLTAIQLTQRLSLEHALFEVVSALGTVGLSMGATARLDSVGKILIMLGMFIGRVGPLTLFVFLAGRARDPGTRYPEDSVPVG